MNHRNASNPQPQDPSHDSKLNSTHLQVDGDLDDVDAHVDDVPAGSAVVPGARVALECVGQVSAVQEVITEVVVASSDAFLN